MSWVGAGGSDWATHCTVSPALPLEVETSPEEITRVAVHYSCLQDLHTVEQLLHSSGQVILVNALERRRGADLDSTCFSVVARAWWKI